MAQKLEGRRTNTLLHHKKVVKDWSRGILSSGSRTSINRKARKKNRVSFPEDPILKIKADPLSLLNEDISLGKLEKQNGKASATFKQKESSCNNEITHLTKTSQRSICRSSQEVIKEKKDAATNTSITLVEYISTDEVSCSDYDVSSEIGPLHLSEIFATENVDSKRTSLQILQECEAVKIDNSTVLDISTDSSCNGSVNHSPCFSDSRNITLPSLSNSNVYETVCLNPDHSDYKFYSRWRHEPNTDGWKRFFAADYNEELNVTLIASDRKIAKTQTAHIETPFSNSNLMGLVKAYNMTGLSRLSMDELAEISSKYLEQTAQWLLKNCKSHRKRKWHNISRERVITLMKRRKYITKKTVTLKVLSEKCLPVAYQRLLLST